MSIYTQADIDTLKAAIVSGVQTVSYNGPPARTVTYQSLDAMRKLLAEMVADVSSAAGTRTSYRLVSTKKGF